MSVNPILSNAIRSQATAGTPLSVQKLGTIPPPDKSLRAMGVYYLTYQSEAAGHSRIAAKLFVPEGTAPAAGWPVTVWCHGLGDPAMDFRRWPYEGDDWQNTRGYLTGRWAHAGYATLVPWLPGAGPSEPLMSYSPLSLARNAQAVADGWLALQQLPTALATGALNADVDPLPRLDHQRQVLRSDCVSTPLLVYLAAHLQDFPSLQGVRALVADDFQPSVAYNISYLTPYFLKLTGRMAAAMRCIWSRTTWALAKEQGWPLDTFFTPAAIELFGQPVETPVGSRDRIFASRLVPPGRSELAPLLESAVTAAIGRVPTGADIRDWVFSPQMQNWMGLGNLQALVSAPFYQAYYAASDPFFAENISPFTPGVPLLVIPRMGTAAVNTGGLPSFDERYQNLTLPKLKTLQSWGWQIELIKSNAPTGTSFSGGSAQQAVLDRLSEILAIADRLV
ncbi:MAG: hypothetical protein AAF152_02130 [Cyanobacteria bacterium P01_A01_bin.114]